MQHTEVIEYQLLAADGQSASVSILANDLRNTALLQLSRLSTGIGQALSVYAVYREGQMTFEASAKMQVLRPRQSLEAILCDLVRDADFLNSLLAPLRNEVVSHFAPQRI